MGVLDPDAPEPERRQLVSRLVQDSVRPGRPLQPLPEPGEHLVRLLPASEEHAVDAALEEVSQRRERHRHDADCDRREPSDRAGVEDSADPVDHQRVDGRHECREQDPHGGPVHRRAQVVEPPCKHRVPDGHRQREHSHGEQGGRRARQERQRSGQYRDPGGHGQDAELLPLEAATGAPPLPQLQHRAAGHHQRQRKAEQEREGVEVPQAVGQAHRVVPPAQLQVGARRGQGVHDRGHHDHEEGTRKPAPPRSGHTAAREEDRDAEDDGVPTDVAHHRPAESEHGDRRRSGRMIHPVSREVDAAVAHGPGGTPADQQPSHGVAGPGSDDHGPGDAERRDDADAEQGLRHRLPCDRPTAREAASPAADATSSIAMPLQTNAEVRSGLFMGQGCCCRRRTGKGRLPSRPGRSSRARRGSVLWSLGNRTPTVVDGADRRPRPGGAAHEPNVTRCHHRCAAHRGRPRLLRVRSRHSRPAQHKSPTHLHQPHTGEHPSGKNHLTESDRAVKSGTTIGYGANSCTFDFTSGKVALPRHPRPAAGSAPLQGHRRRLHRSRRGSRRRGFRCLPRGVGHRHRRPRDPPGHREDHHAVEQLTPIRATRRHVCRRGAAGVSSWSPGIVRPGVPPAPPS